MEDGAIELADRQMEGITATQARSVAICKLGCDVEAGPRHSEHFQLIASHVDEALERSRAIFRVDATHSQLDLKGGGKFGDHSVTDRETCRLLVDAPTLDALGLGLPRQCRDQERRIEITDQ